MVLAARATVLTTLQADLALRALLGGTGRVHSGSYNDVREVPGVYVAGGTSNRSTTMPGFNASGHRTNDDQARADSFAATEEAAQALDDQVVEVMFGAAEAAGFYRMSRTGMAAAKDPDDPGLWHAASTFTFQYRVTDS